MRYSIYEFAIIYLALKQALHFKMADKIIATCWENTAEWTLVYDLIYHSSTTEQKIDALKLIDVWRSRSEAKLPIAVDCTACIISAMIVGPSLPGSSCGSSQEALLKRLALAMTLVRFVNGMTDQAQRGVYARPVQTIAEEICIPDWLVDLRHDATHSSLPSVELLEAGCNVALGWLKSHYWEKTFQSFNESDSQVLTDDFCDLLDQYLFHHWPEKKPDRKFFDSFSKRWKGMMSTDTIRNALMPSLLRSGVLLPSQIQVEELDGRGCEETSKQLLEFWKPLLLWLEQENALFLTLLADALLAHFENYDNRCEARRFVTHLITTFIERLRLGCKNRELVCRILKYCLLDPFHESNELLAALVKMVNFSESAKTEIHALYDAATKHSDVFADCHLTNDLYVAMNYSKVKEYFAAMPIANLDLGDLTLGPDPSVDVGSSWSAAAGISWLSVKEGHPLRFLESHSRSDVNVNLLKLPGNIDIAVDQEIELSNQLFESDYDATLGGISDGIVGQKGVRFGVEQRTLNSAPGQFDRNVMDHAESFLLF